MNQKSTLQFRGGMFMSLIPVAIYTFSCTVGPLIWKHWQSAVF